MNVLLEIERQKRGDEDWAGNVDDGWSDEEEEPGRGDYAGDGDPTAASMEDEPAVEQDLERTSPEYSPLPACGNFIRLLDILPGAHGTPLQCNLRVASLTSQPSYKALSYAWVDETVTASKRKELPIICDQIEILVSRNLHSALSVFRSTESILTLWVDFLCINQQDTEERTKQVGIMRSIYSYCEEVLIWLGPNVRGDFLGVDDDTARLEVVAWHNDRRDEGMMRSYIERFNQFEHRDLGFYTIPTPWERDVFGAFTVMRRLAEGATLSDLRFYKASVTTSAQLTWSAGVQKGIGAIVDASWWQRTWVIQETVLPRKASVYLGRMSAPWTMFANAAAAYVEHLATTDLKGVGLDNRDPLSILAKFILDLEVVRASMTEGNRLPLLSMLRRFRMKKSSDPRDKVFALLGLASDQVQERIKPDYSLNELQVMQMTTVAVLVESRGLDPLAGRVAGPDYRPSWVTNWHELPAGNERERLDCLRLYNASGDQSGIVRLHGSSLELQGCFIGTIRHVGITAPADGGFDRLRNFVGQWQALQNKATDNFWRTVIADTLYTESSQRSSLWAHESKYRRTAGDISAALDAWKSDDTATRHRKTSFGPLGVLKAYVPPERLTALKNGFHYAVNTASGARSFFVTKTGFMGIGPGDIERNDEVYLVLGSRVPLVLRRRQLRKRCVWTPVDVLFDDSGGGQIHAGECDKLLCNKVHSRVYALVGDAYVHGAMDGEFSRGLRDSQWIHIL